MITFQLILTVLLMFNSTVALKWYENANFYQIYPRSYKDTTGNGVGDLNGVREKVPYLKELHLDGIWMSPILKSPMKDFGYDISDYRDIDPTFGTIYDFDKLVQTCTEHGIHVIMDFVPNHTSNLHDWFIRSEAGEEQYADYYVWHPGKENPDGERPLPPSNWLSVNGFSAWEWSDQRQQYYLHQFLIEQPDLNYRNPKVVNEMKEVLRSWLKRGVSGFRIDAVPNIYEALPDSLGNYPDEPISGDCDNPNEHCYLKHIHTMDQPELFDLIYDWRDVLDEFGDKVMMTEAYATFEQIQLYHTNGVRNGSDIPFNFHPLFTWTEKSIGKEIKAFVEDYMNHIPVGFHPNWVLGNHDRNRLATRLGTARVDLYNILIQTLPGNAVTYQGEEIGMENVFISWDDTVDPLGCNTNQSVYHLYSRDPVRTPIPWDDTKNAGFSTADKTWLPINDDYKTFNVANQNRAEKSHLKVFKKLLQIRKSNALRVGLYESGKVDNDFIYTYLRTDNQETYLIVLNFAKTAQVVNLTAAYRKLEDNFEVVTASITSDFKEKQKVSISSLTIPPDTGLVLKAGGQGVTVTLSLIIVAVIKLSFL